MLLSLTSCLVLLLLRRLFAGGLISGPSITSVEKLLLRVRLLEVGVGLTLRSLGTLLDQDPRDLDLFRAVVSDCLLTLLLLDLDLDLDLLLALDRVALLLLDFPLAGVFCFWVFLPLSAELARSAGVGPEDGVAAGFFGGGAIP